MQPRHESKPVARISSGALARPLAGLRRSVVGAAIAALLAGGALTALPRDAAAQSKFAVIDMRRAVLETEEGLRVQANLKKLFDSRQKELDQKQDAIQKEKEQLEKDMQSGKISKQQAQQRYENLQKQAIELQNLLVEFQREMQRKEGEMTTPIITRVMAIVRRIAAQDGYEMVLEKAAVPYFRSDLELTDRAIQMYNGGQTGDTPPAPKAPAAAPAKPAAPAPKK